MLLSDQPTPCATRDPEIWFKQATKKLAINLCQQCPRILQCLDDALETERMLGHQMHGIHGGLDPTQRRKVAMRRIA